MAFFGEWLAKRRTEMGLTIRDIAEAIDLAPTKVSAWERGLEDPPYEVRDACWDALKNDGEVPPLDPAPYLKPGGIFDRVQPAPVRRRSAPQNWIEEMAVAKGTTLEAVLKAFGMSPALKYHWRAGKNPSRAT